MYAINKGGTPMASNRIERINEEIQRELSALLRTLKDPRLQSGLLTVTHVDTTSDLRYSRIFVSALDKSQEKDMMRGLKSAAGYLRRELGAALRLRYTPELQFLADDSIEQGAHILEMLRDPDVVKPPNPANEHIILEDET
jgi:ribosome-binding factor A